MAFVSALSFRVFFSVHIKWALCFQCESSFKLVTLIAKSSYYLYARTISSLFLLTVRIYILMVFMQSVGSFFLLVFISIQLTCGWSKASKWCVWLPYNNARSKWVHNLTLLFWVLRLFLFHSLSHIPISPSINKSG